MHFPNSQIYKHLLFKHLHFSFPQVQNLVDSKKSSTFEPSDKSKNRTFCRGGLRDAREWREIC